MNDSLRALSLIRFHSRVGVRLALRAMVFASAPVVAFIGLSHSPNGTLRVMAQSVTTLRSEPFVLMLLWMGSVGIVMWAAPRISAGNDGWMRHLPANQRDHKMAMHAALVMSQLPVFGISLVLSAGAMVAGVTPSPSRLAGIIALPICAACIGLTGSRRRMAQPAGMVAAGLCLSGAWPAIITGLVMSMAVHGFMGGVTRRSFRFFQHSRLPLHLRIAWRAIGGRLPRIVVTPILALGGTAFFVINNQMNGEGRAAAIRLGSLLAAGLLVAGLTESLALLRPAWPWARSLPQSSGDRIRSDAVLLGLAAVTCLIPAALAHLPSAWLGCTAIPLLALRGASGMRSHLGKKPGPASWLALESLVIAGSMAITPWASIPSLILIPLAYRWGVFHERRIKVTAWQELHHVAAGDTLSWSEK